MFKNKQFYLTLWLVAALLLAALPLVNAAEIAPRVTDREIIEPLFERRAGQKALEAEFHRDLVIQHEDGSRLTRLVNVLREMAKSDDELANFLRSFSLLLCPLAER